MSRCIYDFFSDSLKLGIQIAHAWYISCVDSGQHHARVKRIKAPVQRSICILSVFHRERRVSRSSQGVHQSNFVFGLAVSLACETVLFIAINPKSAT